MRKYLVNFIVANAERFRVRGIDVLAETEWRLRGLIHYFRVGINVVVRKGADVGGTLLRLVECAELARMVDFAAWIDPARSMHPVLLAVGIRLTILLAV
jgi:hypothetical protein